MDHPPFTGRALPVSAWPEKDRRAWRDAQLDPDDDLLAEGRPAARWRPSSKELHTRCYGIWLAWLASKGWLDESLAPEQRVTKSRLAAHLHDKRALGNGARTLVNHVVGLRHMFEALAPDQDWRWLLETIARLRSAVTAVKNHSDLPSIRELFDIGMTLMHATLGLTRGSPKQHAILFRNGLAIALLAARPLMRRNNLATIRIDTNLLREGEGYALRFSGEEMKGRTQRGGPVPLMLAPYIERYINLFRPILLIGKSDTHGALFISAMGKPITPHNLSDEIGKTISFFLARRVTTHAFRHAAGSSVAREDPDHVGIVPSILGHVDYSTSESYYIFAKESAAFTRYGKALERLKRGELPIDPRFDSGYPS